MSATPLAYVRYAPRHLVENIANYAGTLLTQVAGFGSFYSVLMFKFGLQFIKKIPRSILEINMEFSLWTAHYLCIKLPTYLPTHLSMFLRKLCARYTLD